MATKMSPVDSPVSSPNRRPPLSTSPPPIPSPGRQRNQHEKATKKTHKENGKERVNRDQKPGFDMESYRKCHGIVKAPERGSKNRFLGEPAECKSRGINLKN